MALQQHKHFGRAADACYVSQPTLSSQFKKLEKELGAPMLDRSAKGVVFTEMGMAVLERAKKVLEESNAILELAKHHQNPNSGQITIACIPTIGPYLLPLIVEGVKEAFPQLRFQFIDMKTEEITQSLIEGQIDLGVLALPLGIEGLEEKHLYQESFYLAVPDDHPKAEEKRVSEAWLSEEKLYLLADGHCFGQQSLSLCQAYGLNKPDGFAGTSLEVLIAMVSTGAGVTPVPELSLPHWSGRSVRCIPFEQPIPKRNVGLLMRKNSVRQKLFIDLGKWLASLVKRQLVQNHKKSTILPVVS